MYSFEWPTHDFNLLHIMCWYYFTQFPIVVQCCGQFHVADNVLHNFHILEIEDSLTSKWLFLSCFILQCNGGAAIDAMYKELYNSSSIKLMIIGPGCSIGAEPTAEASHRWNLIQVMIGCPHLNGYFPLNVQKYIGHTLVFIQFVRVEFYWIMLSFSVTFSLLLWSSVLLLLL